METIFSLVGQILTAQVATPVYSEPDIDSEILFIKQAGQPFGEVAEVIEPAWYIVFQPVWWLKIYTNQPGKYLYVPYVADYFPNAFPAEQSSISISTPLLLTALLFTGYKSYSSETQRDRTLYGLGAAAAGSLLIIKGISSIDLNPFK